MCAVCLSVVTTGIAGTNTLVTRSPIFKDTWLKKFFNPKNVYLIVLIIFGSFAFLPVLAPILKALQINFLADIIYKVYFVFCHQRASHSFHIFDYQFAYCARDTIIWSTVFFVTLVRYKFYFKPLKWYWFIILSIPMAIDGGFQFIAILNNSFNGASIFYESTNLSRSITGTLFGIGVGGALVSYMVDSIIPGWYELKKAEKNFLKSAYMFSVLSISFFLIIYVLELFTSPLYPPTATLESKPRYYGYKFINEPRLLHSK